MVLVIHQFGIISQIAFMSMEVIILVYINFMIFKTIYLLLFFQVMFPQPQQLQSSQIQFIPWTLLDFIGKDKPLAHHIVTYIQRSLPQVSWLFLVAILITILQFHMAPSVTVQMSSPMIWCAINGMYVLYFSEYMYLCTLKVLDKIKVPLFKYSAA